jgi:chromosomal replication initiation ATPase DnaA
MSVGEPAAPGRGQLALELGHEPSHAADDFIVGEGNRLAYGHLLAFPRWASPLTLVEGPASAGKSHLARIWAELAEAVYATPETAEHLSRDAGAAPLVVEDADRAGYDEAALFHLLNQSMRDRRPVLLTARAPVANWPFSTDDLKSRARLAAHFTVALSSDIQLSQMFVKLFGDRQVAVDPRIIAYLVARMERSADEAVALAGMMDRMALERGTAISRSIAAEALALRGTKRDDHQMALEFSDEDGADEGDGLGDGLEGGTE